MYNELDSIFFNNYNKRINEISSSKVNFVYYTNAATAVSIINNRAIWMRNVRYMNDYSEVLYGWQALYEAYAHSKQGLLFKELMNSISDDIMSEVEVQLKNIATNTYLQTYITCLSEHDMQDNLGRLSMWRAYGRNESVALVFKKAKILSNNTSLGVSISPVEYLDHRGICAKLDDINQLLEDYKNNVDTKIIRHDLKESILKMFLFAAVSIKHPGFQEEKEWRVVCCPNLIHPTNLEKEVVTINSEVQNIYKIPLRQKFNLDITNLLDRIIIGPNAKPYELQQILKELLIAYNVKNAESKIIVSDIPLRV